MNLKIIGAAVAGFAVGYYVCRARLENKFETELAKESAAAHDFYRDKYEKVELEKRENRHVKKIQDQREKLNEMLKESEEELKEQIEQAKPVLSNYQTGSLRQQMSLIPSIPSKPTKRDENQPHIITDEEFLMSEDLRYEQYTLTYYAGDDVLVNQEDKPVEGKQRLITVGEDNLKFGEKSNDPRIVYIRNPQLTMDLEVILNDGKYSVEVLGLDDVGDSAS